MSQRVEIYDTTLRDGAQGKAFRFSGVGKLLVAKRLDEFGVDYIEGGYAASNPKDMEFFHAIRKEPLKHAKVAAFGSTRRAQIKAEDDAGCKALIEAGTPVCTIFGKSWRLHVHEVLRTTEDENRAMIADTVRFLKQNGKEVVYDAEHFFDGYKDSREHALSTLRAAHEAGADRLVLCDTNGGTLPSEIAAHRQGCAAGVSRAPGWASTPTTIPSWGWPTRWPPSRPAPCTCRAPSTVSASGWATPTWSPSSPT
jgi:2-isopropylmalate synthase